MNQDPIGMLYYWTGIVSVFMSVIVAHAFMTQNANFIRSRVFLKYGMFRIGFLVLMAGVFIFAVANAIAMFGFEEFHEVGEIVHNLSMIVFVAFMCMILNIRRVK
jgi:hypothetical protein